MGTIRHATLTSELNGAKVSAAEWDAAHDISLEISDITGLQDALDVAGGNPTIADVTGLQDALDGKQAAGSYAAASHTHPQSDITDLTTDLAAKAATTYVDAQDTATLESANDYTDAAVAAVQGTGNGSPLSGIVSGLGVYYTGSLGFGMSAGSYYLDGTLLTASAQTLSLDAADPTNPRIDVLYVNDSGTFGKVTGTPASSPSQPSLDPLTQLYLTFVLVPAAATELTGITTETIYDEGTEWTASVSGAGFTVDSTNNPNTGTKCIEGTSLTAGDYVKFVDGTPSAFGGDGSLLISLRSKATWGGKRSLTLRFYASGVAVGSSVTLKDGSFGFSSSNTTTYQQLAIAKSQFAVPSSTTVDELRITAAGSTGAAIGLYIDPIKLQTNGSTTGSPSPGLTQTQGDSRYLQRANNLSDLADAAIARTNLGLAIGADVQAYNATLHAQEWAPNFTAAGDLYIPADVAMTISQGNATIGTGTLAYTKSTAAAPSTFGAATLPVTLEAGAWLKVSASAVTGFVATHLVRTA